MEKDFLIKLEYLGVTARIKRLSESLFYSIKELYKYANIDIEPSWHLVLLILKEEKEISMIELAQALNLSKPAITKMIKKMQDMEYVIVTSSAADSRKKIVVLSDKAKDKLPEFGRIWSAGQQAVQELLNDNEYFMEALKKFEKENSDQSFSERAIRIYNNEYNR